MSTYKGETWFIHNHIYNKLNTKFQLTGTYNDIYNHSSYDLLNPCKYATINRNNLIHSNIECIIDLKRLSKWQLYLLWETIIDNHSVRDIANQTTISKSLINYDLKELL